MKKVTGSFRTCNSSSLSEPKTKLPLPFYASGLKFSCEKCSSCCRYDTGYVYLSENDIKNLTSALNMEREKFINNFCKWVSDWKGDEVLSLREKSNKDCILWDSGCTVYEARPLQCITFPFWESIIASDKTWEMAASGCPGMNTGKLHTERAIKENIDLRASEPIISKTQNEFTDNNQIRQSF